MIRSEVSVHLLDSYCSLHGFVAHLQCSLRKFDGECTANPRRLQYDSTETGLRIGKILNRLKKFCSLAIPMRMRSLRMLCECAANALRMRCECAANVLRMRGDSEN